MERNYEITEIRGYSGNYLRQKNGTVCYQGKLDGEENGRAPEIYLESEYEHHIHSVRKKGEKKGYFYQVLDV